MGVNSAAGMCLSVAQDGINLQMVPCRTASAFKYDAAGRLISNATGQCVTVHGAGAAPGTQVTLASCVQPTANHQVWVRDDSSSLRPKHFMWFGLCLKAGETTTIVTRCQDSQVEGWAAGEFPLEQPGVYNNPPAGPAAACRS
jgi:hypothetical protein